MSSTSTAKPGPNPWRLRLLTSSEALPLAAEIWTCYDQVFGDFGDYATWRSDLFARHAGRDGFRLAAATDDDQMIGFAWGYLGRRGQYWSDLVYEALPHDVASKWVGNHFEFVELAVLPAYRGNGLGRALHDLLLDGVRRPCLLSTSDEPDDPAVHLYTRSGWKSLGTLRPGVQVMGHDRT
ncbi:GNAT family N-acetyltransferase [Actinopolymorpha rutila]|uniref:Ribosomal protein S18 acetylase RimI-like enzyme n=1 Tax=Actinopolymorpha rutila TaxID=446787 RepID=A0A852ZPQ0_9ACTN|nr:GNAT family N-acetyltransferase [Actinopolymorpha rutila]NYH90496.1 ribosomal protein S18 acetylase RimI-like enzyme [Actinopolymorpha rutila]